MKKVQIRETRPGTLFRLSPSETAPLWVRDAYDRESRTYWAYRWEDVNAGQGMKPARAVYVDEDEKLKPRKR